MAITIINQPMSCYVAIGERSTVWVDAVGDNLTYQWYVKRQGSNSYARSSVVTSVYSIPQPGTSDRPQRSLYCVISDGTDSVTTNVAEMNIGTMAPLKTQLCRIKEAAYQIAAAITAKGVDAPAGTKLEEFPALIAQIGTT